MIELRMKEIQIYSTEDWEKFKSSIQALVNQSLPIEDDIEIVVFVRPDAWKNWCKLRDDAFGLHFRKEVPDGTTID